MTENTPPGADAMKVKMMQEPLRSEVGADSVTFKRDPTVVEPFQTFWYKTKTTDSRFPHRHPGILIHKIYLP
jgi:hypothetical protein